MSKLTLFRRRAERFAQLLDRTDTGGRHHVRDPRDDELAGLAAISQRMAKLPASPVDGVDPDFRAHLRSLLIETAERDGIGVTARPAPELPLPRQSRPAWAAVRTAKGAAGRAAGRARTRAVIIATVAAGAITVSGMSAATEQALPGDTLYGMKRSTERAQLALAHSDTTRGQLFLGFAEVRMAEARIVHDQPTAFAAVLDDMDEQIRHGVRLLTTAATEHHDRAPLDAIDAFVTAQRGALRQLASGASATATRAADTVTLLDSVRARTQALRNGLTCAPSATVTSYDILGPLPVTCQPNQRSTDPGNRAGIQQAVPSATEVPTDVTGTSIAPAAGAGQSPLTDQPSSAPQQPTLAEPQVGDAEPTLPYTPRPAVKDNPTDR
ncbi:DUF5667 domain-containing protein [Solwaraspora sp. WMMD791]|uniref:DUF5667 domain-containing protein n=1 Tax=Solwaraspora sp. WMMD791 TaxID=3016086 RepID=UPI00249A254C|nr:DUF5667 domain-containing protein [Solwaraspora sp. WMMD791]WFE26500.1 DUF5667 domain-containing protein [Solwaraspora sp. WMMD791]